MFQLKWDNIVFYYQVQIFGFHLKYASNFFMLCQFKNNYDKELTLRLKLISVVLISVIFWLVLLHFSVLLCFVNK